MLNSRFQFGTSTMDIFVNQSVQALFEPFEFGRRPLRNRVVMAPMTRRFSPGGVPGADVATYYRRRAEGGVGLIITEGTTVNHPGANGYASVPAFYGERALAGWQAVAEAVHAAGGAIIPQLWHVGRVRRPGVEPDPAAPGYGPMAIEEDGKVVVKAMTHADIQDVVAAFAQAARDAERIGFDGVELHGAHGYLLDAFLWAGANQRDDEYGGSLEQRLRFPLEVVRAVRAAVRADFPVVYRFSQWKERDYTARIATTPEELGRILRPLADAGVDIFHASTRRFWDVAFEGSPDTLAAWARRLSGKPSIAVGSVGMDKPFTPREIVTNSGPSVLAEHLAALEAGRLKGDFDLIAVGRALLAEPEWPDKVRTGRLSEIRPFGTEAMERLVV
jgi:2,4-dienoyl-CoA reductase-like NADH-dependent reductase (Old Yellow Enzyme family)